VGHYSPECLLPSSILVRDLPLVTRPNFRIQV
jgi:hypothetical protein